MLIAMRMRTIALSGLTIMAAGCAKEKPRPQRPSVPVTIGRAQRADVPYTIVASGTVQPSQTATIAAQVDGIITRVNFHEGQEVAAGQPLFQIEPQPYAAALLQAQATLARDIATADNARREAIRYDSLAHASFATHEQADQQHATAIAALATVASDSAALATARFNLEKTTVRATISGRTGSLLVHQGNLVHASGSTPLVVIDEIRPVLVRFAVSGDQLPIIQKYGGNGGLPVVASRSVPQADSSGTASDTTRSRGARPAGAAPPARGTRPAAPSDDPPDDSNAVNGSLSFIDNAVDTTTGTVMLKASFPNRTGQLWPGQFVSVTLRLFVEHNALVVPSQAIQTGQQGTYVFVVDSANAAKQRPVRVERMQGGLAVIAGGLREGDRVVTEGQSRVTPGATVTEHANEAAPAAGARGGRGGNGGRGGSGAGRAS